ncbi:hypothetical protein OJAV_G00235460 [Oryzias javanicus]|uniref:Nascent polypeptide-associated complex subunit alpha, muscle-specific form-like n=1 Tax=Oryzias javanicus TaxID=123683 RepID=A0A437BYT1_ORYJA|nr:hypothetical protein OJAV_G00235460 [Oryzias javanicus]
MKPDGVAMETAEPAEVAVASEPSSTQDNAIDQVPSQPGAPQQAAPNTNGRPVTVDPRVKTKTSESRPPSAASAGVSGSSPRPGTNSNRPVKEVKPAAPPGKRPATTTASKTTAGVVPRKHVGAVSAPGRNPTRAPAGAARPSAPTVPNGAKPANVNGTSGKRPASNTANGAKPKPAAAAGRTLTSPAPKPGPSATSKPVGAAASKPTRTASGVSAPRASKPTVTTAKTAAATTAVKAAVSKTAAAPPAGRTAVTQPAKAAAAAKKDVGRPPAAAAAKKPAGASALPAARKQEASKAAAASKTSAVSKVSTAARAAETKSKPPLPAKPAATKKPAAAGRFPAANKPLLSQTPPCKPAKSSTPKGKGGAKPVQPVVFSSTKTTPAAVSAPAAPEAADEPAAAAEAAAPSPQEPPQTASPSEEAPTLQSAAPALPTPEQSATAPPPDPHVIDKAPPTSSCPPPAPSAVTQTAPAANLNEEEEEEEKEGSQLVSVSEMSGTTQPTEESRPGSAGPVGESAWRAGGALLSELDSEDVSGSQQGASELSAPGVLEGTESMDDLGDGSLKGAMDMEGASAGSPDFEKVPDIPVIDFDEDEDDSDRVCDMDVDDDVEMASEGVTESGLESYGKDDFAEDERLDNLNREAPPPPPPQLPSAPAAQWDQPNPFVDPWAEPLCLPAAAEPLLGDCVAPPPTAAQAWSDAASFDPDKQNPSEAAEKCQSGNLNSESSTPEDDLSRDGKLRPPGEQADAEEGDKEEESLNQRLFLLTRSWETPPRRPPPPRPRPPPQKTRRATRREKLSWRTLAAAVMKMKIDGQPLTQRCLSTVEEAVAAEDATPPSAASPASFGFDSATTPSNSNAQSTGESCVRSPGIFSLEELSEEAKGPPAEQQYMECRKQDGGAAEEVSEEGPDPPSSSQNPENAQPQNYSAICEKTDDSLAARRDPAPLSRTYYDTVKLPDPPRLTCADLPLRSPARQGASPQLRRLEQLQQVNKGQAALLSPSPPDSTLSSSDPSQEEDVSSLCPPESPEPPSALDLDWGQKVDIVQQQTLLLNGDGCSCFAGGAGGTLSPLESSLWPALLPPLTPPSATVTSVSSFSPDATGSVAQVDGGGAGDAPLRRRRCSSSYNQTLDRNVQTVSDGAPGVMMMMMSSPSQALK